jgi:hypothetical protein
MSQERRRHRTENSPHRRKCGREWRLSRRRRALSAPRPVRAAAAAARTHSPSRTPPQVRSGVNLHSSLQLNNGITHFSAAFTDVKVGGEGARTEYGSGIPQGISVWIPVITIDLEKLRGRT